MDCLLCDHVPWKYGDGMYIDNLYSLDLVLYHTHSFREREKGEGDNYPQVCVLTARDAERTFVSL